MIAPAGACVALASRVSIPVGSGAAAGDGDVAELRQGKMVGCEDMKGMTLQPTHTQMKFGHPYCFISFFLKDMLLLNNPAIRSKLQSPYYWLYSCLNTEALDKDVHNSVPKKPFLICWVRFKSHNGLR